MEVIIQSEKNPRAPSDARNMSADVLHVMPILTPTPKLGLLTSFKGIFKPTKCNTF